VWDFYVCQIDGAVASVYLDLGLDGLVPDASRPVLTRLRLTMLAPRPDGLSSNREAETLAKLEEQVVPLLTSQSDATYVGRTTTAGYREYCFYGPDVAEMRRSVEAAMQAYSEYAFVTQSSDDPEWQHYRETMFPLPRLRQQIENRHVIDALKAAGDAHEQARPIRHWLYFSTTVSRATFASAVVRLGYDAENTVPGDESDPERLFGLAVERVGVVARDVIDTAVDELFVLAEEHEGEYDGWEAVLVPQAKRSWLARVLSRGA
jgi:regulator of RNase E activity RraB